MVPKLVEYTTGAINGNWDSKLSLQGRLDLGQSVSRCGRRDNTSGGEPRVRGQSFEQTDGLVEVIDYLLGRLVVCVA